MPDSKYADDAVAGRLSGFVDYVANNRRALLEMRRQVGAELACDADGIARQGMVIRHLILPHGLSQTPEVLQWIAGHLGKRAYVSLMSQYFSGPQSHGRPPIGPAALSARVRSGFAGF